MPSFHRFGVLPDDSTEKRVASPTRALEVISIRCHVPYSEVTRLYEYELADLEAYARITSFLPIFAMRKVEEALNRRGASGQAA